MQQSSNSNPIWQNQDLGPKSTSLVFVSTEFNLDENLNDLMLRLVEIKDETNCQVSIHGQWIKIKNDSSQIRQQAFKLIQSATHNQCKEIFLPSVNEDSKVRLSSPSPPPPESSTTKSTAQINRKSGLTRSSTETQISSLQMSKTNSPFSVLLPVTSTTNSNNIINNISEDPSQDQVESISSMPKSEDSSKLRYTKDFLLFRSDVVTSKKLPVNWKSLNEVFPSVCFCGKVLSYFNPYKYHDHWEKTMKNNYELHNSNLRAPHTDDYLNLALKDFNHNSSSYSNKHNHNHNHIKGFRNNEFVQNKPGGYEGANGYNNGYKKEHQLGNQFQQNQSAYYLQENHQMKRPSSKYQLNNTNGNMAQKVAE